MDISLPSFLFVITEVLMEAFGLFLAYRFWVAYTKTKDNNLLMITGTFIFFLVADMAFFIATSFLGMTFGLANEWHNIIVNALLILLILVVVRGPGWQEKVQHSRAYVFGAGQKSRTKKRGAA